jgi:hypothetical protein
MTKLFGGAVSAASTSGPTAASAIAAADKWEEEEAEKVRIAGFGFLKLEGSRKESISRKQSEEGRSRSHDTMIDARTRSKSRGDGKSKGNNQELRKEHEEMKSKNQVGKSANFIFANHLTEQFMAEYNYRFVLKQVGAPTVPLAV